MVPAPPPILGPQQWLGGAGWKGASELNPPWVADDLFPPLNAWGGQTCKLVRRMQGNQQESKGVTFKLADANGLGPGFVYHIWHHFGIPGSPLRQPWGRGVNYGGRW